jgi:hypothetical protein
MSFDERQVRQSITNGWRTFRMVHKRGFLRGPCVFRNSLPKESAGLIEQLSISLLCNIWRVFVWVLAHWLGCGNSTEQRLITARYAITLHSIALHEAHSRTDGPAAAFRIRSSEKSESKMARSHPTAALQHAEISRSLDTENSPATGSSLATQSGQGTSSWWKD